MEEKTGKDELFFYLHCRKLLFKGPQLDHHKSSYLLQHFVNLNDALDVCEKVIVRIPKQAKENIIEKIITKV